MANENGSANNFTMGGDLMWHQGQLLMANVKRILILVVATFFGFWYLLTTLFVDSVIRALWLKSLLAEFMTGCGLGEKHLNIFLDNKHVELTANKVVELSKEMWVADAINGIYEMSGWALALSLSLGLLVVLKNIRGGRAASRDDYLRGQKLVTEKQLAKSIKNKDKSCLKIGTVAIPEQILARNFLFCGGQGTGKSVGMNALLVAARADKKKMVIYDKTGELTQKFFRPGIDILLNPLDARCADWTVFADLKKSFDPAMVARFFVPEDKGAGDKVWGNAAKMLLEDVINIVARNRGSMHDIQKIVTQMPLSDLHALLLKHGCSSVGIINPQNEKGSESIRLTLSASPQLRFFSFFNDATAKFSVRDWVRRNDDSCLFLTSSSTQHESVRPFISTWIELALVEAMSMPPTTDGIRMYFFLDELASLAKLDSLKIALTEARKYSIVSVCGIQNLSSMVDIYGEDLTKVNVANLQTKFIMRTEEQESSESLAGTLGKEEVDETSEGKSFGVKSERDGVNLGSKRTERHLVTPTEIMILPDLVGYLKIAGAHPVAKVTLKYVNYPLLNEAYVERAGLNMVFDAPDVPVHAVVDQPKEVETPQVCW